MSLPGRTLNVLILVTIVIASSFVQHGDASASTANNWQQPCTPPITLTASTEPNLFTEEQEVFLGEAVAEHIQRSYKVIDDPEVTAYLSVIGDRLVKHLPINRLRFQFFLVDLPDANAFVIPGGRIFVSRKLVALTQNEDELAGIIAHELGHLVAHDAAIDTTRNFKEVLGVNKIGDRRDVFDKYNQLIENLNRKPDAFKVKDREKGQLFADQAGIYAHVRAGYDINALVRFFDRLAGTEGKKGSWFSDLFGNTRPEQKRLREMSKAAELLPATCKQSVAANQSKLYAEWQAKVIAYDRTVRKESLHGVVSKQQLSPPLRSDIVNLQFSPDGNHILAEDDAGINVLSREPFKPLFRIESLSGAYYAKFSPDSKEIVFHTQNLRVERWSVATGQQLDAKEVVVRTGCLQTELSPNGKLLACLGMQFDLNLINVDNGQTIWRKKDAFAPYYYQHWSIYTEVQLRGGDSTDLNFDLLNMKFSPDGRYLVAGYRGPTYLHGNFIDDVAEVVDTVSLSKLSVSDSVKRLIAGGFTFMGNDRLAGVNRANLKKSGVVKFPSGEVVAELELWRKGMTAATQGDYLLIRPIKDYPLGVLDVNGKKISKVNQRAALDIFDPFFVAEMRNGELGLYRLEKNELVASSLLSNFTLGRLRVAELSPDMKWLALSGKSRGGVWNLEKGEALLSLRGFQGGYLSDQGQFFGDFPKTDDVERNIAKFDIKSGEAVSGPKIESNSSYQFGQFLFTVKSAKLKERPKPETETAEPANQVVDRTDYSKNVIVEVFDARTMNSLWAKPYLKEAPRVFISPTNQTMVMEWDVTDEAAKLEINSDPRLAQQLATMKEKVGDYFLKVLDAQNGNELGKLLIETGKGSFRVTNIFAAGDSVIVTDTENRVLVYSLKTGMQKGRVFGAFATTAPKSNLLCVENETGKLAVYDLETLDKKDEFIFPSRVSMLRLSNDGQRLLVLTATQTVYVIDLSPLAKAKAE